MKQKNWTSGWVWSWWEITDCIDSYQHITSNLFIYLGLYGVFAIIISYLSLTFMLKHAFNGSPHAINDSCINYGNHFEVYKKRQK